MRGLQVLIGILAAALLMAGCAGKESGAARSAAGKLTIVTSFYPIYIATINVTRGVDGVAVRNMTKPQTGCLHDYQLTPQDLKTLEQADAFIVNGAGMEAFLDKALRQRQDLKIVEASRGIELLKDGAAENPHVWVSVSGAIAQARNIAAQLAQLDAAHAAQYQSNADDYVKKLEALRAEMHARLDDLPQREIVTFHEAFPYFAQEFGLHVAAVINREPGSEPSPRELEETVRQIKALGVKALFAEPQYAPGAAETIARESGATVYALDPVVTGEADENAYDAYIEVMRKNAAVLEEALRY